MIIQMTQGLSQPREQKLSQVLRPFAESLLHMVASQILGAGVVLETIILPAILGVGSGSR